MPIQTILLFAGPLCSTLVGAFVSYGILKQRMDSTDKELTELNHRVEALEKNTLLFVDRLARIETKIDVLLSQKNYGN